MKSPRWRTVSGGRPAKPVAKKWANIQQIKQQMDKIQLVPCHVVLFHPESFIQGGLETLRGDLTFCHQADYVPCRFGLCQPPTSAHTAARDCIWSVHVFLDFMGQWELYSKNANKDLYDKHNNKVIQSKLNTKSAAVPYFFLLNKCCPSPLTFHWFLDFAI